MGLLRDVHKKIDIFLKPIYFHEIRKVVIRKMNRNVDGRSLNEKQKHEIRDVYGKYGFKLDFTAHEFYTQKTGVFSPYYLPDDIWFTYIDNHYNDADMAYYFDNKCEYYKMFNGVNMPINVVYRENSIWYNSEGKVVSKKEISENIQNEGNLFIKEAKESSGGHGVTYFSIKKDSIKAFYKVIDSIRGDLVVQRGIEQHRAMACLNDSSVNTIRVLSYFDKKNVHIISSVLRMGINGAKVDNASSGGITCGISKDGYLKEVAYRADGEKYAEHPSSRIAFHNYSVPSYFKVIDLVEEMHLSLPYFRIVSWDFAIDVDGTPVFVEANLRQGELDFHQLNNGAVFEPYLDEMFLEVFQKGK